MFPKLNPSYRWIFMMTGTEKHFFFFSNSNIWLWCNVFLKYNFTNDQRGIKEIPKFESIQYTVYTVINALKKKKNDWNNIFFSFISVFFYVLVYTKSDKNIYPCYSNRTYTCYELTTIDLNIIILYRMHRSNTVI